MTTEHMDIQLHDNDLPQDVDVGPVVAIDTEAMGLIPFRDRLCCIQIKTKPQGPCHLIRITPQAHAAHSTRLIEILADENITKVFHFARFDMAILNYHLGITPRNVYCTKIASRLCRTYTDKHGLKDVCKALLGVEISKEEQTSDWGAEVWTEDQKRYAAQDVRYLHELKDKLDELLRREGRQWLAEECFRFLPARIAMDLMGMEHMDPLRYRMHDA